MSTPTPDLPASTEPLRYGSACPCGQRLPWHLFDMGLGLKHVCSCERTFKETDGRVRPDELERNVFAEWDRAHVWDPDATCSLTGMKGAWVAKSTASGEPQVVATELNAVIDRWQGIRAVALEIAYDNGMINRLDPEATWLKSLDPVILKFRESDLAILDSWCLTLNDEDRRTVASGETYEMCKVVVTCPRPDLTSVFDAIFDPVSAELKAGAER